MTYTIHEETEVNEVWLTLPLSVKSHINSQTDSQINNDDNIKNYSVIDVEDNADSQIISQINSHPDLSVIQRSILKQMVTIWELFNTRQTNTMNLLEYMFSHHHCQMGGQIHLY